MVHIPPLIPNDPARQWQRSLELLRRLSRPGVEEYINCTCMPGPNVRKINNVQGKGRVNVNAVNGYLFYQRCKRDLDFYDMVKETSF